MVAGAIEGAGFEPDLSGGEIVLSCVDIWGNAGGDWVGAIADQFGQDGNISLDPRFCDAEDRDFTLAAGSPCVADAIPGCGQLGAWPVGCAWPTSSPVVSSPVLDQPAPNPCNPGTEIAYTLPTTQSVRLTVHGLDGRLVRQLVAGPREAGRHRAAWSGRDQQGRVVPSGVYVLRLEANDAVVCRRVTVIR